MIHEFSRLGPWLSRYRIVGLVPLIVLGLVLHVRALSVRGGLLMMVAGGTGILAGTLLRIICRTFISSGRDSMSLDAGLVTDGPYAITRNPVFLSEAAIALGIAMMSRMPWLVLMTVITIGLVYAAIIEWQEDQLRRAEPLAFATYSRLVPRWFSPRNFFDPETYHKSRRRVPLLTAVRSESVTMLIALMAILAFIAKANLEAYL